MVAVCPPEQIGMQPPRYYDILVDDVLDTSAGQLLSPVVYENGSCGGLDSVGVQVFREDGGGVLPDRDAASLVPFPA
jgi:hypothetical protein